MAARTFILVGFIALAVLAWSFLWQSEVAMSTMSGASPLAGLMRIMMQPHATGPYLAATAAMWVVMMIAMMTPAVLPVVLVFWRLERGGTARHVRDGALFGSSYLVVWCLLGGIMALLQWGLQRSDLLHPHLLEVGPIFAAWLAIGAGIYQGTALKARCLSHCQSPVGFLMSHWKPGAVGALRMGIAHGVYCVGCCWALMLLMFAGGVMSVGVMLAVSGFILLERLLPARLWATKLPSVLLIGWGVFKLVV
ncbi:MAG: DUF2182 domain-containing protein [Gammaproteobacteria bacterium]|nr:DUF2182 domain-containing protein [Gammaproteobacteria bacterium]